MQEQINKKTKERMCEKHQVNQLGIVLFWESHNSTSYEIIMILHNFETHKLNFFENFERFEKFNILWESWDFYVTFDVVHMIS